MDGVAAVRTTWACAPWLSEAREAPRAALAAAEWPFEALAPAQAASFAFASDLGVARVEFSVAGGLAVDHLAWGCIR